MGGRETTGGPARPRCPVEGCGAGLTLTADARGARAECMRCGFLAWTLPDGRRGIGRPNCPNGHGKMASQYGGTHLHDLLATDARPWFRCCTCGIERDTPPPPVDLPPDAPSPKVALRDWLGLPLLGAHLPAPLDPIRAGVRKHKGGGSKSSGRKRQKARKKPAPRFTLA